MYEKCYSFPALFEFGNDEQVGITFPDICGCTGQCSVNADIMAYAQETLEFHLSSMLEDGEEIPTPTPIQNIETTSHESVMPVRVYLSPAPEYYVYENLALK